MQQDYYLERAAEQVRGNPHRLVVQTFFDEPTFTASYVVHDPGTHEAAILDSVCDFDQPSGRTSYASADAIIAYVKDNGLTVEWLLETHAHADHLSAAPYLQEQLGERLPLARRSRRYSRFLRRYSTKSPISRATDRSSTFFSRMVTAS